jgi:nuclear GTP-binding protein
MPKKSTKSRSKRVTLHQKYKVLKKIKEHHRKKAKELKKKGGRVKPPKDPGIPAAWPFKEQLLQEIEFERQKAELAKQARKDAAKERRVRCALSCAAQRTPQRAAAGQRGERVT